MSILKKAVIYTFVSASLIACGGGDSSSTTGTGGATYKTVTGDIEQSAFYSDSTICKAAVGFVLMVSDFHNMSVELMADGKVRVKGFAPYNGGDYDYLCNLHDGKIDFYNEKFQRPRYDPTGRETFEYKILGKQLRIQMLNGGNVQKENYFGLHDGTMLTLER